MPAHEERAPEVELDDPPELLDGCIHHTGVLRRGPAGIVVDDVDLAVSLDGGRDGRGHAPLVGDVGVDEVRIAPLLANTALGVRPALLVDLQDRDPRTLRGEQSGRRPADAPARPGDHRHLAVEPSHGIAPLHHDHAYADTMVRVTTLSIPAFFSRRERGPSAPKTALPLPPGG